MYPPVFQSVNFTLQSSLHGIDFELVQNGVIFYNCLVFERYVCMWTSVSAYALSAIHFNTTADVCLFQLLILYKSVQLQLVSS